MVDQRCSSPYPFPPFSFPPSLPLSAWPGPAGHFLGKAKAAQGHAVFVLWHHWVGRKRVCSTSGHPHLCPSPLSEPRHKLGSRNHRTAVAAAARETPQNPPITARLVSPWDAHTQPVPQESVAQAHDAQVLHTHPSHLDNDPFLSIFHLQRLGKHAHESLE